MAENPFAQFVTPGVAVGGDNPFSRFVDTPGRSALEGIVRPDTKTMAPAELAKYEFGIDVTGPTEEVRAAIASLPADKQAPARDIWAKHFRANEKKTQTKGQRALSSVNDVFETIARGTPIGSWGDEIDARLKQGAYALTGGGMGAPYDEALAYNRARQAEFDQENPNLSFGLKIAGGVASAPVSPMLKTAQGASMLSRIGAGTATGAGYGFAYGLGEGTDAESRLTEAAKGTAVGATIGGVSVPVAQGLGNLAKYTADKFRSVPNALMQYEPGAVKRASRAMVDDELYLPTAGGVVPPPPSSFATPYRQKAAELGPEGMLADMGANMLGQAKAVSTLPGAGQQIMRKALEGRKAGARDRIMGDTNALLGSPQNLVALEKSVTTTANNRAAPLYKQFEETPVKVSERLYGLLDRAKADGAFDEAAKRLARKGFDPNETFYKGYANSGVDNAMLNGRALDQIKRVLDDKANEAAQRGQRELAKDYKNLSREIRDEVDGILSPGDPAKSIWAQARETAKGGLQFREGLEDGASVFTRGTHPDQMAADLKTMSPSKKFGYVSAARGQIRDIMGNAGTTFGPSGDNAARKALGSEFARDKLKLVTQSVAPPPPVAGQRQMTADGLIARLDAESAFERTRQQAYQGTETAARLAAQKEFPNKAARSETANEIGKKSATGMMAEAGYRVMNALLAGHLKTKDARVVVDTAKMLSAQGASRDQIAYALMQYARSNAITARGRDAIGRLSYEVMNSPRFAFIDGGAQATGIPQ